jgi:hypothetical protein
MGWLNTVLDVANVGMNVAQLGQLNDLRKQGATSAAIQALLHALRNRIFEFKQSAQSIVDTESAEPKVSAGALRVLEMRLEDSGITPDLFSDLNDKEYVASTYRFIQANSARMRAQLSPAEIGELESMADAARLVPEYKEYVDNYSDLQRYKEARENMEKLGGLTNPIVSNGIGCLTIVFGFLLIWLFASVFNNIGAGIIIGGAVSVGVAIWVGGFLRKGKNAKKAIAELENNLEIESLMKLDNKYGGSLKKIKALYKDAKNQIDVFFHLSSDAEHLPQVTNLFETSAPTLQEKPEPAYHAQETDADIEEVYPTDPGNQVEIQFAELKDQPAAMPRIAIPTGYGIQETRQVGEIISNETTNSALEAYHSKGSAISETSQPREIEEKVVPQLFCMMCGFQLPQEAMFCPRCGAAIKQS